jgi:hypothetical protein
VVLKEMVDNAIDACEEAGIAPEVRIKLTRSSITVADNGPGIAPETIASVLDFTTRTSSREAYVSPTRGAQGNALKTILAMPFVLDGALGRVGIISRGIRHKITFKIDQIRQQPVIEHARHEVTRPVRNGTSVTVAWPVSALLSFGVRQMANLTIRRRLRLHQPAPSPDHRRRGRAGHPAVRSGLAEVEAVRSDFASLVPARSSGALDRRVPEP